MSIPGLTEHQTWNIVDSTKLQSYQRCPRMYFYEYVVGWHGESDKNDLVFGSAWHIAQEVLLLNGYTTEAVQLAYKGFEDYYRQYFNVETDEQFYPKAPASVLYYLPAYIAQYASDRIEYETLYTEIGGRVSIGRDRAIYFKMDSILRHLETGLIISREHKTAKSNSRQWRDKWKLATQIGTYDHALRCMYGSEQVEAIVINAAFFTKLNVEVMMRSKKAKSPNDTPFLRIEVKRLPSMSNVWLFNTNQWFDELDRDMDILMRDGIEGEDVMPCFKQNTESCTDYWGCKYLDFCLAWSNPLQRVHTVPIGFIQDFWDPSQEGHAETRVNL